MQQVEERPMAKLALDPQPRKDVTVPPMVDTKPASGVMSVRLYERSNPEAENVFSGLTFGAY